MASKFHHEQKSDQIMYDAMKWLAFSAGLVLALGMFACDGKNPAIDPVRLQHMTSVRDRIKKELGERYDLPIAAEADSQLQRGQKLFGQLCAACHGARGDAKGHVAEGLAGHPSNFTDPAQAGFYSEQARVHIIRKGVPGTPMMAWENLLTEEDVMAVYVYVRSLKLSGS
jgi:mono/diheme cytochrome c family protein